LNRRTRFCRPVP